MKIPLTSGGVVETNDLNDKSAAIHEAISHLYTTCEKFNIAGFTNVVMGESERLGMLYLPNQSDKIRHEEYRKLVASLSDWLHKTSDGRLIILDTEEDRDFNNEDDGKGLE